MICKRLRLEDVISITPYIGAELRCAETENNKIKQCLEGTTLDDDFNAYTSEVVPSRHFLLRVILSGHAFGIPGYWPLRYSVLQTQIKVKFASFHYH